MKKAIIYFAGIAASLALFSCNKDDGNGSSLTDGDLLKASASIDYVNESDFQYAMETAGENSSLRQGKSAIPSPCADVSVVTGTGNTYPKTFTINFGTGCINNGIIRSGILSFSLSGDLLDNGTVLTISRNNYRVNGYLVEGTVVYTSQTADANVPQWSRTVGNGQIITPDGLVYTHSGTRTVKQTAGASTPLVWADNVFEVTAGTHTVTGPNGNTLTATVAAPLIKNASCFYISQGVLNLQGTYLDGDLNYGNNNCDNNATYTHSDGTVYNINL